MNINEIVPSRIYSWVYAPDAGTWSEGHLKKGGRAGLPENPLFGRVTVRSVKSGQAGTMEMYQRKAISLNPHYSPDSSYTPRLEQTSNPCVFRSLATGEFQVLILNGRTNKVEYFVDGQPATAEQLATIKMFMKSRKPRTETQVKIEFPYIHNLANVEGGFVDMPEDLED